MKPASIAAPLLVLIATLAAAAPAAAWQPEVPSGGCYIQYHEADWRWYRICMDPKDISCPVYTETQTAWTTTRSCVVEVPPVAADGTPCFPTSGNLEETYLCVDLSNPRCPVYTTGPGGTRCYPLP